MIKVNANNVSDVKQQNTHRPKIKQRGTVTAGRLYTSHNPHIICTRLLNSSLCYMLVHKIRNLDMELVG